MTRREAAGVDGLTTRLHSREATPITWTLPGTPAARSQQSVRVGVLALQGDFQEHILLLKQLEAEPAEVRCPQDLEGLQALILPGGESTSMARLLDFQGLREPLKQSIQEGTPTWGTCAGLILLARRLQEGQPCPMGVMDIEVARNAYGRQMDSFEEGIEVPALGEDPFHAVFIRAPAIMGIGPDVEVLARLSDGTPVAARQGHLLVTTFHPELTLDTRFHSYFLSMVAPRG